MQSAFYISHDGKNLGPWSISEVLTKLEKNEIQPTDYIFDEHKQDWLLLMEHAAVTDALKKSKPKAPPAPKKATKTPEWEATEAKKTVAATPAIEGDEWFVLKWDNRYGPFSYLEMVRMLQEKSVFEFDYVWKAGMETWARIAELDVYHEDKIRDLRAQKSADVSEAFFRRRHARTHFNGSIIVHDSKTVWKGKSMEVSEGGAGIVMYNAMVLPGQTLYVHFQAGDSVPPFNAVVEVVSKKFVKGVREKNAPITYGIRFVRINKGVQKAIQDYVASKVA